MTQPIDPTIFRPHVPDYGPRGPAMANPVGNRQPGGNPSPFAGPMAPRQAPVRPIVPPAPNAAVSPPPVMAPPIPVGAPPPRPGMLPPAQPPPLPGLAPAAPPAGMGPPLAGQPQVPPPPAPMPPQQLLGLPQGPAPAPAPMPAPQPGVAPPNPYLRRLGVGY